MERQWWLRGSGTGYLESITDICAVCLVAIGVPNCAGWTIWWQSEPLSGVVRPWQQAALPLLVQQALAALLGPLPGNYTRGHQTAFSSFQRAAKFAKVHKNLWTIERTYWSDGAWRPFGRSKGLGRGRIEQWLKQQGNLSLSGLC